MADAALTLLTDGDREPFIPDSRTAFRYGAAEEFGKRDGPREEDGELVSRTTVERSIDSGAACRIREDGRTVGGAVLRIDEKTQHNRLDPLSVFPEAHSRGPGFAAWHAAERLHPETRVREACTPYFEKRSIHFYINKRGFHAVAFFRRFHPDPRDPGAGEAAGGGAFDGILRFEKRMKESGEGLDPI